MALWGNLPLHSGLGSGKVVIGVWGPGHKSNHQGRHRRKWRRKNCKFSHPIWALNDPEVLSGNTNPRHDSREGLAGEMLHVESGTDGRVGFLQWELGLLILLQTAKEPQMTCQGWRAEQDPPKCRFLSQVSGEVNKLTSWKTVGLLLFIPLRRAPRATF